MVTSMCGAPARVRGEEGGGHGAPTWGRRRRGTPACRRVPLLQCHGTDRQSHWSPIRDKIRSFLRD
jgi:hypothetical protein